MIGRNLITWCPAQMHEAIETYLNEHILQKKVTVISVRSVLSSGGDQFEISVEAKDE